MSKIINKIIDLTSKIQIKTIRLIEGEEEILVDYTNISKYRDKLLKGKILISKKYFKLFDDSEQDYLLENCLEETFKHKVKLPNGKILLLNNISIHAIEQFIRRSLTFYEIYGSLVKKPKKDLELIQSLYDRSNRLKDKSLLFEEISSIENIILSLLESSKVLHQNNMGRVRDKKEFAKRDNKYKESLRLTNHPFLFIVNDRNIVTCELYSSSFKVRFINNRFH